MTSPELCVTAQAVYVIVRDPAAGRSNRYTVHRISRWGQKRTRVIGRELPIGHSRRIVRDHVLKDALM